MDDKEFKSWMIATLRRASYRWPPRYTTMKDARVERGRYKCKVCDSIVGRKEIRIDHIEPVVDPKIGFKTWDLYIERMFCSKDNFQALCLKCHKVKTSLERKERFEKRAKDKKKGKK